MIVFYVILAASVIILLLALIIKPKEEPTSYSWEDSLDPTCITVDEIANKTSDILVVYHDYGHGGWQFYDGNDVRERNPKVLVKSEILGIDKSINEIISLKAGWKAERKFKGGKWKTRKI